MIDHDDHQSYSEQARIRHKTFLWGLVFVTALFLWLLKPFAGAIFWAVVFAMVFNPMHERVLAKLEHKPNLAALCSLLICVFIVIVPVLLIVQTFIMQGAGLYERINEGEIRPGQYIQQIYESFPAIEEMMSRFNLDLKDIQERFSSWAVSSTEFVATKVFSFGQSTLRWFISLGIMLYVTFFMFRDGDKIIRFLILALPIGDTRERILLRKFTEVTRATVKGNILVAMIQGALGGLIFWILGISAPLLWGVVMAFLSLIPAIGASLVWAPVAIYLMANGEWVSAIVLIAYGALIIGLADNALRPVLVGRDTKLPDYIVLISTLGGFSLFGINGFVVGPVIAALFFSFWGIFIRDYNDHQEIQELDHDIDDKTFEFDTWSESGKTK